MSRHCGLTTMWSYCRSGSDGKPWEGIRCQLHILILQSAEVHNTLLRTQGVPLRLINIKQVVNPFAILGPEYCFILHLLLK